MVVSLFGVKVCHQAYDGGVDGSDSLCGKLGGEVDYPLQHTRAKSKAYIANAQTLSEIDVLTSPCRGKAHGLPKLDSLTHCP